MNWKNTGMEKHGQIKVKPRENEKNKNLIMPVMQLVLFFMHINLKRDVQVDIKIPTFFLWKRHQRKKSSSFALLHS